MIIRLGHAKKCFILRTVYKHQKRLSQEAEVCLLPAAHGSLPDVQIEAQLHGFSALMKGKILDEGYELYQGLYACYK